jgi:acylglycerol lipase
MKEFFLLSNHKKINIIEDDKINNFNSILINIHGLGSHFQPIYNCDNELSNRINMFKLANIKTFAIELSGHGKSDGIKGLINNYDDLLLDLKNLVQFINYKYPNKHIFLLGESLGGALSIKFSILYKDLIKGIVLLAPLCDIPDKLKPSNLTKSILKKISYIFPTYKMLGKKKMNGCLLPDFNDNRSKNTFSYNDKLMLSTGRECLFFTEWIKKNSSDLDIPILIFHAKNDNITDFNASEKIFNDIKSKDKEFVPINYGHHSLLVPLCEFDIYPSIILSKICNWINFRL